MLWNLFDFLKKTALPVKEELYQVEFGTKK
jgi:hypothetical protein